MSGYVTALLEDYGEQLKPEGQQYATRMIESTTRMDSLIQDLLA